jgi:hypothetical protein
MEERWRRFITSQSVAAEALSQLRFHDNPQKEVEMYARILKNTGRVVSVCMFHIEDVPESLLNLREKSGLLSSLTDHTSFNVLVECNDSLSSIYSICSGEGANIIEVGDIPREAVNAVFVPSLLSDEVHVEGIYSVTGGRVGLLEKFFVPLTILNEHQKLTDMEQEQRYRSGKENRPSAESKELQVDPLVHKREVAIRDSPIDGILKAETDLFEDAIDRAFNQFQLLIDIRQTMSDNEFKVFVIESVRGIADKIRKNGSLPLPAELSPLDIAHPVILALLKENILMVRWLPCARIVEESALKLLQLDAWSASQLEDLSGPTLIAYNLALMKNRIHISKQLDKLSR